MHHTSGIECGKFLKETSTIRFRIFMFSEIEFLPFFIFRIELLNFFYFKAIYVGVVDFARLFICLNTTMTFISVLCIFGDETTTQFGRVYERVCECPWNEFPLEIQKYVPMILMTVEKPVYLSGYMSVRNTREFMKQVSDHINWEQILPLINFKCFC